MKRGIIFPKSRIHVQPTLPGVSLEEQIRKMMSDKEPIQATAKIDYSDRKDGVLACYDIRHDKFEYAIQQTDRTYAAAFTARTLSDKGFVQNENGEWGSWNEDHSTWTPMPEQD